MRHVLRTVGAALLIGLVGCVHASARPVETAAVLEVRNHNFARATIYVDGSRIEAVEGHTTRHVRISRIKLPHRGPVTVCVVLLAHFNDARGRRCFEPTDLESGTRPVLSLESHLPASSLAVYP